MNYEQALFQALSNEELVANYDRLNGNTNLADCLKSIEQGGINLMIDSATDRINKEIEKFDNFFNETVWSRLPEDAFKKSKLETYVFQRADTFYLLELKDDEDAIANAKCNPGTIKVTDMLDKVVWEA